jgi:hypothetical protein
VLKSKQSIVREDSGVRVTENGENAALMGGFVVLHAGRAKRETSAPRRRVKRHAGFFVFWGQLKPGNSYSTAEAQRVVAFFLCAPLRPLRLCAFS